MRDFVHLHNHTHYSILDAAAKPEQLVLSAKADNQSAIAITDHGVMFGCMEFYKAAKREGIKPIIGFEAYMASGSRYERIDRKDKDPKHRNYYHLVLLAKNEAGYKNLIQLTTLAHLDGFYYKPRIDKELLETHHEGVIALSACIAGVVNVQLIRDDIDEARAEAQWYKDLFGEDFYLEIQNHYLDQDKFLLKRSPRLAKELGIKLVATNDIHYLKKEHAVAHNILLYIRDISNQKEKEIDVTKLRYGTPEMYFKTKAQMNDLFHEFPNALDSTIEIAEKCNFEFKKQLFMPEFPIPKESKAETLDDYFEELTYKGLNQRFTELTDEIKSRVEYEVSVIRSMGFSGYFLIVQDFINAARNIGVSVGPGRGSAAGSLVAYALGITNVNPLKYDLLFERFLNPERISMPDIDIDFSDVGREKVINYVKTKYGEECVAQIVTFGKLSTRAVLKDVGRVLNIPHTIINEITAKIPAVQGKVTPLAEALELPDLKDFKDTKDEKLKTLIEYSLLLENKIRNTSTHAAGVVIAPSNVVDYVPLYQMRGNNKGQGADISTQYGMKDLEDAGLLKMDFLGLATLSIIDNTLDMIKTNRGATIDLDNIDFYDEKTYNLFATGNTLAVFQFESKGMQEYLRQLKPRNLEELTAMNALYRPGPMDNIPEYIDRKLGKKPITYLHPKVEESLKNTYGIIVYQEQVMQLARAIGGFSLGGADLLRRAMGKKDEATMASQKTVFLEGAAAQGIDKAIAEEIFELIHKFAKYGFNKSHSLAYSYLAYQTAWLKAHYPAEFYAANMTAELNDQDKIVSLMEEAKKSNMKVLHPDVNRSMPTFTVVDNSILFGLAAIKNVGINAVESIITARDEKPFSSFFDFAARVGTKAINKRALEALICAGAFDTLCDGKRSGLFHSVDIAIEYSKSYTDNNNSSMDNIFGGMQESKLIEPSLIETEEWNETKRLEKEKEYLSFYVSGSPMLRYSPYINSFSTLKFGDLSSKLIGEKVRVCGLIKEVKTRMDKRQNNIAFVKIEDFTGVAECIFWSDSFNRFRNNLQVDKAVICEGKSESDGEMIKIIVDNVREVDDVARTMAKGYSIWINLDEHTEIDIQELQKLCVDAKAKNSILFNCYDRSKDYRSRYIAHDVNISFSSDIVAKITEIFGRQNVKFLLNI